jgi:hypothetical protein
MTHFSDRSLAETSQDETMSINIGGNINQVRHFIIVVIAEFLSCGESAHILQHVAAVTEIDGQ